MVAEEKVKRLEMEEARKERKGHRDASSERKKENERRISEIAGNLLDVTDGRDTGCMINRTNLWN